MVTNDGVPFLAPLAAPVSVPAGVPPGLEYLTQVSHVIWYIQSHIVGKYVFTS